MLINFEIVQRKLGQSKGLSITRYNELLLSKHEYKTEQATSEIHFKGE